MLLGISMSKLGEENMAIRKVLHLLILAASISMFSSCSSVGKFANGKNGEDAQSFGLGGSSRFESADDGEVYTTKAPHNQVYLFAFDNSKLDPKYIPSVEAQAKYLAKHKGAKILLAGHTDERGSREYNVALGERRAQTVYQLMRMHGVNKNQMRVVSYGKERLVNFDHDERAHRQNRRVELIYEATR